VASIAAASPTGSAHHQIQAEPPGGAAGGLAVAVATTFGVSCFIGNRLRHFVF
jgi:hypothetical protein